jgi:hypothetical protein
MPLAGNAETRKEPPMAPKDWESIIQRIVDESNQEPKEVGKHRLLVRWRAKLEKEPPHLPLHHIDQIVREVRRRLESVNAGKK